MNDNTVLIHKISKKVDEVLAQNKKLREQNDSILAERERLIKERMAYKERISNLEQELNVLKFSHDMISSLGDKDRAKRKLKSILREIDHCIALLNK